MKKGGYDQFFQAAREAKNETTQRSTVKAAPAKSPVGKKMKSEAQIRQALKMPPQKTSKPFPFAPVAIGFALISAGLGYLAHPDLVENLMSKVQVRVVGQLEAEEAKTAAKAPEAPAKLAAGKAESKKAEGETKERTVAEDTSYIDKLRSRKEELDLREKELNQLEEELQRQKVEVDQRIHQLEQMRRDIASVLKERVEADETQVNKLVDLYSTMKPKQAADVIGGLQEDLAVQVLGKMKKKNAAEVMNVLPSEKARVLSERLTGYKR